MSRKHDLKKGAKTEISLTEEELGELEIVLDRLSVQNPEGETFDSFIRSLCSSLAGQEALVAGLIEKLSKDPSQVGFKAFAALRGLIEGPDYRRFIKRAGYRFSQKGFSESPVAGSAERVVRIPREIRKATAHMVPFEDRLWLVTVFIPESDYPEPLIVAVFPEKRLLDFKVRLTESSYKRYRESLQGLSNQIAKPCEVPVWHAAKLLEDLIVLCGKQDVGGDLERARRLLQPYYDPNRPAYAYELMPPPEETSTEVSEAEIKEVLESIDVSPLLFNQKDLSPYRERLVGLERSVLVIPDEIQRERAEDLTQKAADELWVGRTRRLYQRFFEEQAMWQKLSSNERLASVAWKMAQQMREAERGSDSHVVATFVVVSMRRYWPQDFETKDSQTDPYETTGSGLIIPR